MFFFWDRITNRESVECLGSSIISERKQETYPF